MKILFLGAGAVGGYFGARLHQAGADVTFLLREPRAAKIAAGGLVVKSPRGDATVPVKVVTSGAPGSGYDLAVLTCKAYDLEGAMDAIAPAVGPGTAIVPLLNGLRHIDTLRARFGGSRVVGGLARIGAVLGPEGEVRHTSPFAALSFGEFGGAAARQSLRDLDAAVKAAGIEGGLHDKIEHDLWSKWIMLASLASMCCALRGVTGDILASEDGTALMLETVDECRAVAAAAGFDPGETGMATVLQYLTQRGSKFAASMLADLEKGGPVEAAHVVGDMLARARAAGLAAPNLRFANAALQTYEARRARGGLPG